MKILLSCILFCFATLANADNYISIDVNANQPSFIVNLPANPTTGFQWNVAKFDKRLLTLSNRSFQKPQTNMMGAGGQMFFTFKLNPGQHYPAKTKILFKYARSWEHGGGTTTHATVNFLPAAHR